MNDALQSADISIIKRILPHRYPFLMVDRVERIDGNRSAVGIKNVTINEPFFQGHFPNEPVMPGVLILEAMGQTAAVMIAVGNDLVGREAHIYLMSVDKAKFRRKVVPGDVLELHVTTLRGATSRVVKLACEGKVGDETVAEAEITAMISVAPAS
ncbi:3-hydroxyacyl-[acyl-carrier-protein] dehydratase [Meinhardsimonia xiamenensis]|jgi:3-hydroxyacyl-[acyl-carrier-protein] dehydratase|uniref:3-hydroxyacyl-[acyl-carrier-protein] dehydratase FabZ n=1 Tax=Meinhardsimonia xiamenensis TaxID=990712 RepID=A0A1G9G5T1_9RHOB|nr:3-hydroxyacyl-ACP dehydratase FabZ [Meinhardsimonia xiamenensis]PRX32665.1 3-hydroxyacyl-[acyl-carrier-protein] dehydratase [Meinhardsimonia xiamenensis]SDK96044.1 3-hydroxyacyl-[acyl-carrier-protein] dehydratase [Meinhardsimonia xiamenensis]